MKRLSTFLGRQRLKFFAVLTICAVESVAAQTGAVPTPPFDQAAVDAVYDQLENRWYEIEVIIFERLPVMNFQSVEDLVTTTSRSWPNNLRDLASPGVNPLAKVIETELEIGPSDYCIGVAGAELDDLPYLQEETSAEDGLAEEQAAVDGELASIDGTPPEEQGLDSLSMQAPETSIQESELSIQEPEPTPEELALAAFQTELSEYESSLWATSFTTHDNLLMQNEVRGINRQQHLRPVIHRRWHQAVPARDAPLPVKLSSAGEGHTRHGLNKVEGFIEITVSRYLHAQATLWYQADNLGERPTPLYGIPAQDSNQLRQYIPYMQLSQSRRMRSRELHYIDHPKLGLLIRIDPVTPPNDLITAWQALSPMRQ